VKVADLIALLQRANPEAPVEIYNPDAECYAPVTGMVYSDTEVQLCAEVEEDAEFQDDHEFNESEWAEHKAQVGKAATR